MRWAKWLIQLPKGPTVSRRNWSVAFRSTPCRGSTTLHDPKLGKFNVAVYEGVENKFGKGRIVQRHQEGHGNNCTKMSVTDDAGWVQYSTFSRCTMGPWAKARRL